MNGWQAGATCFESVEEAGAYACAQAYGVTSSGLLSCSAVAASDGLAVLNLSNGTQATVVFQSCYRPSTADFFLPVESAFLVCLIAIWSFKRAFKFFKVEHET